MNAPDNIYITVGSACALEAKHCGRGVIMTKRLSNSDVGYTRHDKYAAVEAERDELRREVDRLTAVADLQSGYLDTAGEENAQLRARLDAAQWQPIETAPKDGRLALVFRPLAHMSNDENIAVKKLIGGNQTCWNVTVPAGETPCNPTNGACHVTHWMPLPITPPAGGETNQ